MRHYKLGPFVMSAFLFLTSPGRTAVAVVDRVCEPVHVAIVVHAPVLDLASAARGGVPSRPEFGPR